MDCSNSIFTISLYGVSIIIISIYRESIIFASINFKFVDRNFRCIIIFSRYKRLTKTRIPTYVQFTSDILVLLRELSKIKSLHMSILQSLRLSTQTSERELFLSCLQSATSRLLKNPYICPRIFFTSHANVLPFIFPVNAKTLLSLSQLLFLINIFLYKFNFVKSFSLRQLT
jgi:hypothetical protein